MRRISPIAALVSALALSWPAMAQSVGTGTPPATAGTGTPSGTGTPVGTPPATTGGPAGAQATGTGPQRDQQQLCDGIPCENPDQQRDMQKLHAQDMDWLDNYGPAAGGGPGNAQKRGPHGTQGGQGPGIGPQQGQGTPQGQGPGPH